MTRKRARRWTTGLTAALALGVAWASGAEAATVFVTNEKDNTLSIIDSETDTVIETVQIGQRPRGIIANADNTQLLICASDDDRIEVMDVATRKITHYLPSGPDPELLALHPDGRTLFVANEDDNLVTVVDLEDRPSSTRSRSAWSPREWA